MITGAGLLLTVALFVVARLKLVQAAATYIAIQAGTCSPKRLASTKYVLNHFKRVIYTGAVGEKCGMSSKRSSKQKAFPLLPKEAASEVTKFVTIFFSASAVLLAFGDYRSREIAKVIAFVIGLQPRGWRLSFLDGIVRRRMMGLVLSTTGRS